MSNRTQLSGSEVATSRQVTRREMLALTGNVAVVTILTGCGGGNKAVGSGGRVQLRIAWPQKPRSASPPAGSGNRYIPPYAASLVFEMYRPETPDDRFNLVTNRPDDRPS